MNAQLNLSRSLFLSYPAQSRSRVRSVVLTIIGLHAIFLLGLLMQGYRHGQTNSLSGNASLRGRGETALEASFIPTGVQASETTSVSALEPLQGPETGSLPVRQIATATSQGGSVVEHTVVAGDTLSRIAKQQHVSLSAVLKANPDVNPAKLRIGQKIEIPVD